MADKIFNDFTERLSPTGNEFALVEVTPGVYQRVKLSNLGVGGGGGGDVTAPTVVSATVENANPNQVVVVFSESVMVTTAGWSFRRNTANWAISSVAGSGTTWTFTMATSAANGETIDRSYNPATGATVDGAANELASFTNSSVTNNVGGSYDTDAQAYFTAVEGAGYTFGTGEKAAIDAFVVGLKADGLWTKIAANYPMIGSTFASKKWNLRYPVDNSGSYVLAAIGSPTYTATGIKNTTNSDAINTQLVPSAAGITVAGNAMGIYIRDNISGNHYDMGCVDGASAQWALITRNSDTYFSDNPNSGSTGRFSGANTTATRLWIQTRQSATAHKLFRDGVQVGSTKTDDVTGETYPTTAFYIGGQNGNGLIYEGNKEFCYAFIANAAFSDTDVANMTARVNTLVTALGRNV